MTTSLTDEALAEIEAGLKGVTEGPWTVDQEGYRRSTPTVMSGGYFICTTGPYDVRGEPRGQTATHIARLNPETVAAWLARDKAQRAEIERLREALAWYGEQARLCRLVHSAGDLGRRSLDADGGVRARDALDGREPRDKMEEK